MFYVNKSSIVNLFSSSKREKERFLFTSRFIAVKYTSAVQLLTSKIIFSPHLKGWIKMFLKRCITWVIDEYWHMNILKTYSFESTNKENGLNCWLFLSPKKGFQAQRPGAKIYLQKNILQSKEESSQYAYARFLTVWRYDQLRRNSSYDQRCRFIITAVTTSLVVRAVTTNFVVTVIVTTKLLGCLD